MNLSPELTNKLLDSFSKTMSVADKAAEEGGKWLDAFIEKRGLDRDRFTKADWFLLTREIPCTIRCWRIGEPVDVRLRSTSTTSTPWRRTSPSRRG